MESQSRPERITPAEAEKKELREAQVEKMLATLKSDFWEITPEDTDEAERNKTIASRNKNLQEHLDDLALLMENPHIYDRNNDVVNKKETQVPVLAKFTREELKYMQDELLRFAKEKGVEELVHINK